MVNAMDEVRAAPATAPQTISPVASTALGKGRFLAIDTATEASSVALWVAGEWRARRMVGGREQGSWLRAQVDELLLEAGIAASQLDGLACGIGPGGFAGVRTGVAYVQGLALVLQCRVMPLVSLELLASSALQRGADQVLASLDARMGEVYHASYRAGPGGRPVPVMPPGLYVPQRIPAVSLTAQTCAVGSAWGKFEADLCAALGGVPATIDATAVPDVADGLPWIVAALQAGRGLDPALIQPFYLRNKVALTQAEQIAARKGPL